MAIDKEFLCSILDRVIIMSDEPQDKKDKNYAILDLLTNENHPRLYRLRNLNSCHHIRHLQENILSMAKPDSSDDENESVVDVTHEGMKSVYRKGFSESMVDEVIDVFRTGNIPKWFKEIVIALGMEEELSKIPGMRINKDEIMNMVNTYLPQATNQAQSMDTGVEARSYMRNLRRMAYFTDVFPPSEILWERLGDKGAGFVLEYDFNNTPIIDKNGKEIKPNFKTNPLVPVKYDGLFDANKLMAYMLSMYDIKKYAGKMDFEIPHDELLFIKIYTHKVRGKAYESEWRFLSEILDADSEQYGEDMRMKPVSLYCGPKMPKENKRVIFDICSKNGIKFYELDDNYNVIDR